MNKDLEAELLSAPSFTAAPTTEQSQKLTDLGRELYQVDATIERLEQELEDAKKKKIKLTMEDMPAFMDTIHQDRVGLPEFNVDLVMEPFYHANIKAEWPEEQREAAFEWLEKSDNGDMIKLTVSMMFPRTAYRLARWVLDQIALLMPPSEITNERIPEPILKKEVPWNTLTAFVKREIEAGNELPLEVLGATVGRVVKIKPRNSKPKGKRK